jgi:hypothetical protein
LGKTVSFKRKRSHIENVGKTKSKNSKITDFTFFGLHRAFTDE